MQRDQVVQQGVQLRQLGLAQVGFEFEVLPLDGGAQNAGERQPFTRGADHAAARVLRASGALQQAGSEKGVTIVSIDGGCDGVDKVKEGVIGATSQQYPIQMAELGVKAIKKIADGGKAPKPTEGLDFYDTGVKLVTDQPEDGVESIDTTEGSKLCWG